VRRLKWKFPYLADGYIKATAKIQEHEAGEAGGLAALAEAELMFKLDFFEYYMLIERALVHLLGVFNIAISRGFERLQQQDGQGMARPMNGARSGSYTATHMYHQNVLDALSSVSNPLHPVLGTGTVRLALSRAKELRNRWKYAGDTAMTNQQQHLRNVPLESYDLENVLMCIFDGFDRAYAIAEQRVIEFKEREREEQKARKFGGWPEGGVNAAPVEDDRDFEEQQWGFMVEAMDWEAV
jgi:hypothetical protein